MAWGGGAVLAVLVLHAGLAKDGDEDCANGSCDGDELPGKRSYACVDKHKDCAMWAGVMFRLTYPEV